MITGCSWKVNSLFNLINHESDVDKIYLYPKDSKKKKKNQFLIKEREVVRTKYLNDWNLFTEYSNNIVDIYKNIEEYNPNKKRKILIFLWYGGWYA